MKRIVHVAVFVHTPVRPLQVIVHQLDAVEHQSLGAAHLRPLLPIKDVRFGDLRVRRLDQYLFDYVLNLLHVGDVPGIVLGKLKLPHHPLRDQASCRRICFPVHGNDGF